MLAVPFDCELIRQGLIAQPTNTISSLAFIAAALVVGRRHWLGSIALASIGVGSVLFHAVPSRLSSLVHDLGLLFVLLVAGLALWSNRTRLPRWPLVLLVAGILIWAMSRTGGAWCSPQSAVQGHAVWHVLAATGLAGVLMGGDGSSAKVGLSE